MVADPDQGLGSWPFGNYTLTDIKVVLSLLTRLINCISVARRFHLTTKNAEQTKTVW